jgi:uncharacterized protein
MAVGTTERTIAAAESVGAAEPGEYELPQYTTRKILALWAAATLPMGAAAWIAAPMLATATGGTDSLPKALLVTLTLGLVWQSILVAFLVYREQRTLSWSTVSKALWLRAPQSPKTGRRGGWLWLIVLLMIAGLTVVEAMPAFPHPLNRDLGPFLATPAGHAFLHGAWGWLAVIATLLVFNTVLGEELLFRGLLLPRMNRAFGRFDWLANGVLFALYHVHVPWAIPAVLVDSLFIAYPARRYRSALISILAHSAQSVVILALATSLVLAP